MRITTKLTIDISTGAVLEHRFYEYSGVVAECKKGRGQLNTAANQGNQLGGMAINKANSDTQLQNGYRGQSDVLNNSLVNTNGGLSSVVAKQLANQKAQIAKTYQNAALAANRGLAQRGMGVAPTGLESSIRNTAINNEGQAETSAVGDAFGKQLGLNENGLNYLANQQRVYNPVEDINAGSTAVNAAPKAGEAESQAGSLLGDIGAGLMTFAGPKGLGGFGGLRRGFGLGSNTGLGS
jgi:hypothetical protein